MALVRRNSVLGQAGQMVAAAVTQSAVGRAQVPGGPQFPGQPGQPGEEPGAAAIVAAGPVQQPGPEAAAVPSQPASFWAILSAFALLAAGGAGSWAIWNNGMNTTPLQLADATSVFGTLLVFATAVERTLEPFSRWLPGRGTRAGLELAIAEMANRAHGGTSYADLAAVARAKAKLEKARANRMFVSWGITTGAAAVISTASGFYLLRGLSGPQWNGLPIWMDAVITGIVVGSGTKPIHDVISRVQRGKEQGENP
jgi:hypothetical protein